MIISEALTCQCQVVSSFQSRMHYIKIEQSSISVYLLCEIHLGHEVREATTGKTLHQNLKLSIQAVTSIFFFISSACKLLIFSIGTGCGFFHYIQLMKNSMTCLKFVQPELTCFKLIRPKVGKKSNAFHLLRAHF